MEITLKGAEIECAKKLAQCYSEGRQLWSRSSDDKPEDWEQIGCTESNYEQVLGQMELVGAISDITHCLGARWYTFTIDPRAVQIARALESQEEKSKEGKDILESIKLTLKKHPVAGWLIAFGAGIVLLATAITQIHGAMKALGIVAAN